MNKKCKVFNILEWSDFKNQRYAIATYIPDREYEYEGQIMYFVIYDRLTETYIPFSPIFQYIDESLIEYCIELNAKHIDDQLYLSMVQDLLYTNSVL